MLPQDALLICSWQNFSDRAQFLDSLFPFPTVIRPDMYLIPNRKLMAAGYLGKKKTNLSHISTKSLMTNTV